MKNNSFSVGGRTFAVAPKYDLFKAGSLSRPCMREKQVLEVHRCTVYQRTYILDIGSIRCEALKCEGVPVPKIAPGGQQQ